MSTLQANADTQTPPTAITDISTSSRRKFPSEEKTIICTVPGCTKTFNRPARLLAHLRSHNNERPYKCTYDGCDKAYADKKHLNGHILSAHTKEAKFSCTQCGKGFATGQRLKRHALVHEGEERYKCREYPPCDQSFRKHQTLQRHILKDHLGEKPYKCTHKGCPEGYDTANALKAHTTREHGELRFWCDECSSQEAAERDDETVRKPVGFTTQWLLEQHIRQEHVNCVFCDVKFGGQYQLEKHMEIYHSGLSVKDRKNIECEYPGCDKRFTKKSNMKIHYRTAHKGMRFVCGKVNTWGSPGLQDWNWTEEGCGQGFTGKAGLEQHILYVHLGKQRPYVDFGTKNLNEAGFLDEISGVAELERRQVICDIVTCGARFMRHADLHNHVQAEHPDQAGFGGLLGESETPQPDWGDVTEETVFNGHQDGHDEQWAEEDASIMQLLDLDNAIDPNLLTAC